MGADDTESLAERVWRELGGEAQLRSTVTCSGPEDVLPSVFDVTGLAAATVGAATLAAAELLSARRGESARQVHVDRRQASAAFLSEALFAPQGWQRPPVWDPIAGDYRARDGWIKLHTNYRSHRAAVERVLGPVTDREAVAAAVSSWSAHELQDEVVTAGGCAAAMNDRARWLASPGGAATADESIVRQEVRAVTAEDVALAADCAAPLSGVRVLDLTRVIAGPICTRFLAAYGAEVLRIDPPGFEEVGALVPITTEGKRCAALDLGQSADRNAFEALLGQAHVVVTGLRPGAMDNLGYDTASLQSLSPGLITASLDAYGWSGPWSVRRGFDSLVQMSSGIAASGAAARGVDRPIPLPAQALDHGTGYILAAGVCRALTRLIRDADSSDIRSSLIATANLVIDYPAPGGFDDPQTELSEKDTEPASTAWGPARRVPVPGHIAGVKPRLATDAGLLGRDEAAWTGA